MSRFATISRRNLIMPWKMLALAVLLLGFGNHALAGVIWNLNATFTDGMTASGVFVTDDSMDFTSWDVFFAGGTLAHDFESSSATLPPGAIGVEIPGFQHQLLREAKWLRRIRSHAPEFLQRRKRPSS